MRVLGHFTIFVVNLDYRSLPITRRAPTISRLPRISRKYISFSFSENDIYLYVVPPNLFGSIVITIVFVRAQFLFRVRFFILIHIQYIKSSTCSEFHQIFTYGNIPFENVNMPMNNESKSFFSYLFEVVVSNAFSRK